MWGALRSGIAVGLLSLVLPATAAADIHAVTFDAQTVGTTITSQYADAGGAGQGVTFGADRTGAAAGIPPTVESSDSNPLNHVGSICNCGGEFGTVDLWGSFKSLKHDLSIEVGALNEALTHSVSLTLTIFLSDGTTRTIGPFDVTSGAPLQSRSFHDDAGRIAFFELAEAVHVDRPPLVVIDNVTYDVPAAGSPPPSPVYGLAWAGPPYKGSTDFGTSRGHSVTTSVGVERFNGSTGPLRFTASGYPSGVTVTFSDGSQPPASTLTTSASPVTVAFAAAADAALADHQPVTITASPVDAADAQQTGPGPQTATIPLTVLGSYSVELRGIEVVQGVQSLKFGPELVPPGGGSALPELPSRDPAHPAAPVLYSGVGLAAGASTVARVWGSVANPSDLTLSGVTIELHGFSHGAELPGSPIVSSPMTITPGSPFPYVTESDMTAAGGSWDIPLPQSWTTIPAASLSTLTLQARLVVPQFFSAITQDQCETPGCAALDSFTLTGIPFTGTNTVPISTVGLTYPGDRPLLQPPDVFGAADAVTPVFDGGLGYSGVYDGMADVSQILLDWKKCRAHAMTLSPPAVQSQALSDCNDNSNDAGFDAVEEWKDNNPHQRVTIGVGSGVPGGMMRGEELGSFTDVIFPDPNAVVNQLAPLTSVSHELFHALGRNHAGTSGPLPGMPGQDRACGGDSNGQYGTDWPPDQRGLIHGVGYNRSWYPLTSQVGVTLPIGATIASTATSNAWDFMSYCASNKTSWVSDRNWQDVLNYIRDHVARDLPTASAASAGPALRVIGFANHAGVTITNVDPVLSGPGTRPVMGRPTSSYALQVKDGRGRTIAEAPMEAGGGHHDPSGTPFVFLTATLPVPGVATAAGVPHAAAGPAPASVSIISGGAIVATRTRPKHVPVVRILSPKGGATVGRGRFVALSYRVRDPDRRGVLSTKVDYSLDDGHTFRMIWMGPATGRAQLPRFLVAGSRHARIRVRVNDGFNEGSAVSARFAAVGSPPRVMISSPRGGSTVGADGTLELYGRATDDRGRVVGERGLRWFAGRKLIGRGSHVMFSGFGPGRLVLRLVARGSGGRTGSASVVVRVRPAVPHVLSLSTPRNLPLSATSMPIQIATTVPAKLHLAGRVFVVSRRTRRLTVPVTAGGGELQLMATLVAGPLRSSLIIGVPRG